jgi:uncharacterized protein YegL
MGEGGKIQALNNAIREALPEMAKVAAENPNAKVMVRALKFSSGAQWINPDPVTIDKFKWTDLEADGVTDLGAAFKMVAAQLKMPPMPDRALPPVLVLISDGQPTDDWKSGLKEVMDQPWGKKAVRIAISIGTEEDNTSLQEFIGNVELKPLNASNPESLVKYIKWASTAVVKSASAPASKTKDSKSTGNVEIPEIPPQEPSTNIGIW